ncbi:LysB [Mycobacterium phage Rebeuca]|uniref:Lysin B n=2 Tax=Fromanvirus rebeuca TaxID=1225862 RepID=A0A482JDI2_9CAUD|nr:LysB [Mycobacterium phage Rebeuca]AFQ97321.1 LysB [Mycobacterium phage Rebeuca]QBP31960.1 lysin B [Mycobacterium phage Kristoff]
MALKLGSSGELVNAWIRTMNARFESYSKAYDGGPLREDAYFGYDDAEVQREYERRTGQPVDGEVSDHDLVALGLITEKPWLFTVHGTAQPDPLGPGLPADTAKQVLDLYRWQPIGNYPAKAFPMWPSIMQGYAELVKQIEEKLSRDNSDFALAGYSQGAVVVGQVLKHEIINPNGRLHKFLHRLKKVVFWGNPMRQKGIAHFDEWIHPVAGPDTMGILEDRLENLEQYDFEVRDYAHEGDMYASIKEDDMHEYQVAIGRIVMKATDFWGGKNSVVAQLAELAQRPLWEGIAVARAIIDAIGFATNMGVHGYNIGPAVRFLRELP